VTEATPPPVTDTSPAAAARARPLDRWLPAALLLATTGSVAWVGHEVWGSGWQLAAPLMAILVAHETGHYVAARCHGERPSLPYFLPLPWLNPFGTLGAVLFLDARPRPRRTLLDVGAAGPLAGLVVALPLLVLGLVLSPVEPLPPTGYAQEGQSILYWVAKRVVLGPLPPGHDVTMHPVLGAAWAGLFVTFLNLLPVGHLDGGHVAFALLRRRHGALARRLALLPSGLAAYNLVAFAATARGGGAVGGSAFATVVSAVLPWVLLQLLLLVLWRSGGFDHPEPSEDSPLGLGRRLVGWATLSCFGLLFMPSPWVVH